MGVDFLDFLRSGEKDIHAFAESRRGRRRRTQTVSATGDCTARDQRGGAVSRFLAFLASRPGENARLWVRALDSLIAQELTGTDGAIGSRSRSRIGLELSPSEEELLERLSFCCWQSLAARTWSFCSRKKQEKMERPSDITGLIYVPFTENIAKEAGVSLAKAMDVRGYKIDIAKL